MLTGVLWQSRGVKAFLSFSEGVPAQNTDLHSAHPEWLVGITCAYLFFT